MGSVGHRVVLLLVGLITLAPGCTTSEARLDAPGGAARGWINVASMSVGRVYHQAVLLPPDRVLLAGGMDRAGTPLSSAEIYDDASRTVTLTPSMRSARWGHTATRLSDGRVLVVGGIDEEGATDTVEVFTPEQGTWAPAPRLRHARFQHGAVALAGGDLVLVVGGFSGESGEVVPGCEIYDRVQNQWLPAGVLQQGRSAHTITLLDTGKVLVAGGQAKIDRLSSTEIFDPATALWTRGADLSEVRQRHAATRLTDGRVLVVGGQSAAVDLFEPRTGLMTAIADLDLGRSDHSLTAIGNAQALLIGGQSAGGVSGSLFDTVELFDSSALSWTLDSQLNTPRQEHRATLLASGRVLISGGSGLNGPLAGLELSQPYDAPPPSDGGPTDAADAGAADAGAAADAVGAADAGAAADAVGAADAGAP